MKYTDKSQKIQQYMKHIQSILDGGSKLSKLEEDKLSLFIELSKHFITASQLKVIMDGMLQGKKVQEVIQYNGFDTIDESKVMKLDQDEEEFYK